MKTVIKGKFIEIHVYLKKQKKNLKQTNNKGPIKRQNRDNAKENKRKSIFNIFRAIKDTASIKQTQGAIKKIKRLERVLRIRNMILEYTIQ